ncbi:hypothetical protein ACJMK2_019205, partial [Sinanodonta woodiana]
MEASVQIQLGLMFATVHRDGQELIAHLTFPSALDCNLHVTVMEPVRNYLVLTDAIAVQDGLDPTVKL